MSYPVNALGTRATGHGVAYLVEAPCYKPKVAGLIPYEVTEFFNSYKPSSHTMTLGLTQPLTEMSTRNLPGGKVWPARKVYSLTAIYEPIV
jgi:hypothetical protein